MKKIIFIVILLVVGSFYFITDNNELVNDYYDTVNDDFFSKDYLKDDEYIYNTFVVAQEESNLVRDGVIGDIINGRIVLENGISSKINNLYSNVLDIDERNNISISPLKKYIDMIMNSNNINELISRSVVIESELDVDIFTRVEVDNDFVDNSKNIVYLYPVTFAFGSSVDYYVDEDYMTYKAYIKRAIIQLLIEYGYNKSEAKMISSEVISFYSDIGNSSKLSDSYEDVTSYYNVVDALYLSDVYDKFDIVSYLNNKGIAENKYSLVDEGQYRRLNEYLNDEYLMLWKKVILVEILSSYAIYLDNDYYNIIVSLNNSLIGVDEERTFEEDAINLVGNVFSSDIDKVYEQRVISEFDKSYLRDLFSDIKKCFRKMLEDNSWLSDETKEKALVKLDSMKVYVGLDGTNSNAMEFIEVNGDNLVSNIISINKSVYKIKLDRLKENNRVKALSDSVVNAYYSPMENAVYVPSSVMFLIKSDVSYYEKLGTIGMIIAHEITHGFDYNGSLFDEKGNMNNWWVDADRENYAKLKSKVIKYYSGIEVLDGKYIDGQKTVNENIADMGALSIISNVARVNGATKDEFKEMYSAFAKFWRTQVTDNYAKLLLLNDTHSPNKYRVNAVLSLTDEFYNVYDVYPWNNMYISKDKRVSVW